MKHAEDEEPTPLGVKHDGGKLALDLIPFPQLIEIIDWLRTAEWPVTARTDDPYSSLLCKLVLNYLPLGQQLEHIVEVLEFGLRKYARDNWQHVQPFVARYEGACARHLKALWLDGETYDKESGLRHAAHAACCLIFLRAGPAEGGGGLEQGGGVGQGGGVKGGVGV